MADGPDSSGRAPGGWTAEPGRPGGVVRLAGLPVVRLLGECVDLLAQPGHVPAVAPGGQGQLRSDETGVHVALKRPGRDAQLPRRFGRGHEVGLRHGDNGMSR